MTVLFGAFSVGSALGNKFPLIDAGLAYGRDLGCLDSCGHAGSVPGRVRRQAQAVLRENRVISEGVPS